MKRFVPQLLFLALCILSLNAYAEAPKKLSYQAVVRNSANALIKSTTIGMQITILQGSESGTVKYSETQTPTTNINGLVSVEIGAGNARTGDFETIDWSEGPYLVKIDIDPQGGNAYAITSMSQLLSVPYALHAASAEKLTGGITETDPIFTQNFSLTGAASGDILKYDGAKWVKETPQYLTTETDPVFTQNFSLTGAASGDILKYDGTKWVKETPQYLSAETDPVFTQNFSLTGATSGDILKYNGTKWVKETPQYLSAETDPVFTQNFSLTGAASGDILKYNGTKWVKETPQYLTAETDPAFTQNFSLTGAASGDLLKYNGTKWVKETPQYLTAETDPTFTQNFSLTGAASGDLLKYNGTKWVKETPQYLTVETDPAFTQNFSLTGAASGDLLKYNGTKWVKETPQYLTAETDPAFTQNFSLTGAASGDILKYNGTKWVKETPQYLTAETDPAFTQNFSLTGAASGDLLKYNGTKWVKETPQYLKNTSETVNGDMMYYDGTNWVSRALKLSVVGTNTPVSNMQPYLVVNYCIALTGIYPSRNFEDPIMGMIATFGFDFTPKGWAACNGQLLPVAQYTALFSLLGAIYGGNGSTTFGLPDLKGRVPIQQGQGTGLSNYAIGQQGGNETITLTTSNLPAHNHTIIYE